MLFIRNGRLRVLRGQPRATSAACPLTGAPTVLSLTTDYYHGEVLLRCDGALLGWLSGNGLVRYKVEHWESIGLLRQKIKKWKKHATFSAPDLTSRYLAPNGQKDSQSVALFIADPSLQDKSGGHSHWPHLNKTLIDASNTTAPASGLPALPPPSLTIYSVRP